MLDTRRLEAFCKVYELRSFSKAGQDLYLSQPTISAHIASLEDELGVTLFDRVGREVIVSRAGEILYKYVRKAFTMFEQGKAEIDLLKDKVSGELSIGGSTIPAHYFLPNILSKYKSLYSEVKINLEISDSSKIAEKVIQGRLDVGVVGAKYHLKDLEMIPILEDELILVGGKAYQKIAKQILDSEAICSFPWVIREKGSGTRKAMEEGLEAMEIKLSKLNIAAVVQSTAAVMSCVQAGLGVSVTSKMAAADLLERRELVILDVPSLNMQRKFYTIYHRRRHLFPAAKKMISTMTALNSRS